MQYVFYPDLPAFPKLASGKFTEVFPDNLHHACYKNGIEIVNSPLTRQPLDYKTTQWCKQNISPKFHSLVINHQGAVDTGSTAVPHTDTTRQWTLMWFTDVGGTEVKTVFWQERGFDAVREPRYYPKRYEDLIELESHVFEPHRWVLINSQVIHSVENIQSVRKSIQIGFWKDSTAVQHWIT
jgi:hypothetical protein